jgi:hypothetical protein
VNGLTWFALGIVPAVIFAVFLAAIWSRLRGSKRAYTVLGLCAWIACGLLAAFSPNRVAANYYIIADALIFLFLVWPMKKT